MRTGIFAVAALVMCSLTALAARSSSSQPSAGQGLTAFEENVELGARLSASAGHPDDLKRLDVSARSGLAAARKAVEQNPDSAEAHYLLGSWLLYGYRVVATTQTVTDPDGTEHSEKVQRVVQGLSDDWSEGLEALKRASVLAPARGQYLVDYGAALLDCEEPEEARKVLEAAWAAEKRLAPPERMQAAILLSRISLALGIPREAREWAYSGLRTVQANKEAVARLRHLDRVQAQAASDARLAAVAQECPFVICPGRAVLPREGLEPRGIEVLKARLRTPEGTVMRLQWGEWALEGRGGWPLRIAVERRPSARGTSFFMSWVDQPFQVLRDDTLVAVFANTQQYWNAGGPGAETGQGGLPGASAEGPGNPVSESPFYLMPNEPVSVRPGHEVGELDLRVRPAGAIGDTDGPIRCGPWAIQRPGGGPLRIRVAAPEDRVLLLWVEQPFELRKDDEVLGTFQNTRQYWDAVNAGPATGEPVGGSPQE